MPHATRVKGNTTSILIIISILLLLLVPSSARMIPNAFLYTTMNAYGQANKMNSNLTNPIFPENIPLKRVHAGDIDIAYKMFGKGEPERKKPVDVLGLSRGGYVAQELTLTHPREVNKLILYGTDCGGKATILSPQIIPLGRSIESGNASLNTYVSIFFPKEWLKEKENAAYVQKVFSAMTPTFNTKHKRLIIGKAPATDYQA